MKPNRVPDDLIQAGSDAIRAWYAAHPSPNSYLDDRTQMRIVVAAALTLYNEQVEQPLRERAEDAERELAEMRAERGNGMAWNDWCVRILVSGGAVTTDHDDEDEARGRYEHLVEDPERAQQLVRDATSYPSPIRSIELLCRTHWEGDYRVVESASQQPGLTKERS